MNPPVRPGVRTCGYRQTHVSPTLISHFKLLPLTLDVTLLCLVLAQLLRSAFPFLLAGCRGAAAAAKAEQLVRRW